MFIKAQENTGIMTLSEKQGTKLYIQYCLNRIKKSQEKMKGDIATYYSY